MHIVAITQRPRLCSCRRIIRRNSGNSTQQQPATDHWAMCRWSQREKWEGGVEGLGGLDGVKVLVSSLLINSSPSSCDLIRTSSAMNHSCTLLTKLEVVVVGRGGRGPRHIIIWFKWLFYITAKKHRRSQRPNMKSFVNPPLASGYRGNLNVI